MYRILSNNGSVGDSRKAQPHTWDRALEEGAAGFLAAVDSDEDVFSRLELAVGSLYNHLARFEEFHAVLAVANGSQPSPHRPWGWQPIEETEDLRIGLLVVYRFGPIPLHDHPKAYGAQRVIAGGVRIRQFDEESRCKSVGSLRTLKLAVDQELEEGGTASFAPTMRNIHGLETAWPRSVLLSVTAPPHRDEQRAWYYPLPLRPPEHSSILVNRVRRRPFVGGAKTQTN